MAAEPASLLIAPESSSPVTPAKRRRSSGCLPSTKFKKPMAIESPPRSPPMDARLGDHNTRSILNENHHMRSEDNHPSITLSASARLAGQTVAPFLAKHIPDQYAPLGGAEGQPEGPPNANNDTKYCYRHRPDSKCRRQADEPSMDQLQSQLETLTQADQQGIAHMWSLFSAAPSKQRELMLRGILTQCCFPQLSFISASVRDLIRIDFVTALPAEISFKILCYLDTTSLCKAAQVSQRWRGLADDDVVWHKMCEQHIDRKCTKCGWGLPLLERKRLRASKRQIQLRATGRGMNVWSPDITPFPEPTVNSSRDTSAPVEPTEPSPESDVLPAVNQNGKRAAAIPLHDQLELTTKRKKQEKLKKSYFQPRFRPWKEVYKDRFKVCTNWKYGRCSTKIFRGHTNGVMCLQFDDKILATGSYDATIRIWDIDTGEEVRSLRGHTAGVRALQFDDTKLISGSLDKSLKVWNWHTGECISTYTGHTGGVISLNFDASILVSGSVDSTIKIWNFEDKSTFLLRGHTDWVNAVKLDSPSRTVFSASDDCTVRLWDLDTKACLRIFEGHVGQVQQVIPLPAEFELETAMRPAEVSTSLEIDPTPRQQFAEPFNIATERPLPPRYMVTSALDSTVRLWDVAAGRCIRTFFGHVEGVWALAADTLRVVSGAEDRMVKVWDARTGRCERTFTGHAGPVTCIGLSDSKMVTGSEDHEVRVYSFKPDGLVPTASGSTHTAGEDEL